MNISSFPQRKSPRLQGYDYAQNGAYFVTICTHKRQKLFGKISDAEVDLNTVGCIAQTCWEQIPIHFPKAELDAFVVMPNHVHGILLIIDDSIQVTDQYEQFSKPIAQSLSTIMRSYKSAVTNQVNWLFMTADRSIWQGRFHDHIVRNERSLNILREYVINNPARWEEDRFYNIDYAGHGVPCPYEKQVGF